MVIFYRKLTVADNITSVEFLLYKEGGNYLKVSNREYKSDVFSMLMEYPEYAMDVYKALGGMSECTPEMIEIKTLEKGISLSIRNDAAFIIDTDLHLYEHQSTYNPNMPLRSLIYLADILKPMLKEYDLYGKRLITIPKPKFVVFYNGEGNRPEIEKQRLSDAYKHADDDGESIELICTVYNINPDKNEKIKADSYVLDGYMKFVEKVRKLIGEDKDNAETVVERAVDYCIENEILSDFFRERKQEVIKIMTLDMTFEAREKIFRREERLKEFSVKMLDFKALVDDGILSKDDAAKRLNMSLQEFDDAVLRAEELLNPIS